MAALAIGGSVLAVLIVEGLQVLRQRKSHRREKLCRLDLDENVCVLDRIFDGWLFVGSQESCDLQWLRMVASRLVLLTSLSASDASAWSDAHQATRPRASRSTSVGADASSLSK